MRVKAEAFIPLIIHFILIYYLFIHAEFLSATPPNPLLVARSNRRTLLLRV